MSRGSKESPAILPGPALPRLPVNDTERVHFLKSPESGFKASLLHGYAVHNNNLLPSPFEEVHTCPPPNNLGEEELTCTSGYEASCDQLPFISWDSDGTW